MRVTISVGGIWHAFYVAEQLYARGCLKEIITGYPRFRLGKWRRGVPWDIIKTISLPALINALFRGSPVPTRVKKYVNHLSAVSFDYCVSAGLDNSEIFLGWPTFCLNSLRKAKSRGIVTLMDVDHSSKNPFRSRDTNHKNKTSSNDRVPNSRQVLQKQLLDGEYAVYAGKRESVSLKIVIREWK